MKYSKLPKGPVTQLLQDESDAAEMERTLTRSDPNMETVKRERRYAKAGTYTLAEKYGLKGLLQ